MKKEVSAREFLHRFAKIHQDLRPGESVTITRHRKRLGQFVKEDSRPRKVPLPDFEKDASASGYGLEIGDQLLRRILQNEALS